MLLAVLRTAQGTGHDHDDAAAFCGPCLAMASFTGGPQKELHPPGVMTATGTVAMAEAMTRSRQRIRFTPDGVGSKGTNVGGTNVGGANVKGDWRLIVPAEAASLSPGDRVTLTARLQHPLSPVAAGRV